MSASLVGSEMCIRDSSSSFLPAERSSSFLPAERLPSAGVREGARAAPVSYTHLTLPTICSV
eukprot:6786152-Alexandrium_andersonii.AAC.1